MKKLLKVLCSKLLDFSTRRGEAPTPDDYLDRSSVSVSFHQNYTVWITLDPEGVLADLKTNHTPNGPSRLGFLYSSCRITRDDVWAHRGPTGRSSRSLESRRYSAEFLEPVMPESILKVLLDEPKGGAQARQKISLLLVDRQDLEDSMILRHCLPVKYSKTPTDNGPSRTALEFVFDSFWGPEDVVEILGGFHGAV